MANRLEQVVGVPFAELAGLYGRRWKALPTKNKGYAGNLIEFLIGGDAGSEPKADISSLGIEVKSIPIGRGARVLQPTKVGTLNYTNVVEERWEESNTFHKLRAVLFVPVVKHDPREPGDWFVRRPFLWMPSEETLSALRVDYDSVRAALRESPTTHLSSAKPPKGFGISLHPKPNAANKEKTQVYRIAGTDYSLPPKAWMLRPTFTNPIVQKNLAVDTQTLGLTLDALSKRAHRESDIE